ncbi:MAG: hypothetical protein KDA80_08560 [Planctomycetaceae bacterium]|nr:hypothetical protein [Planctomycetaceae bacterium]
MPTLALFDAFGIELEYMVVDRESLDIRPISDFVLRDPSGAPVSDLEHGEISWSNELTHHVIELKTSGPAPSLIPLPDLFQANVREVNSRLREANACLLPTAMHPWMDPDREMQLWPYEYHAVYETFHKIFDCRGHGWANLQSMHINLPFASDEEFRRLHAACRLVLPFLPGLAASSPFRDGIAPGPLDCRLDAYRRNAGRVPSVAGRVIPEPVYDEASYHRDVFEPMLRDVAPYDPGGVLKSEFLNARGAIARFSRGAIEIRVIDVQECPPADLAIAALTVELVRSLVEENWSSTIEQMAVPIEPLERILIAAIDDADEAIVDDATLLRLFGIPESNLNLREFWQIIRETVSGGDRLRPHSQSLDVILSEGCLARRMVRAAGKPNERAALRALFADLADCLEAGELFQG